MVDGGTTVCFVGIHRYDVAYLCFGNISDVNEGLVHAYSSADRCRLSADEDVPLTGKLSVDPVGVTAGNKRQPGGLVSGECPAVAYRYAGLYRLDLADDRFQREYRANSIGKRVFDIRTVTVHHDAGADEICVKALVEQNSTAVLAVHGDIPAPADVGKPLVLQLREFLVLFFERVGDCKMSVTGSALKPGERENTVGFLAGGDTYAGHSSVEFDVHRYFHACADRSLRKFFGVFHAADGKQVIFVNILQRQRNIAVAENQDIAFNFC